MNKKTLLTAFLLTAAALASAQEAPDMSKEMAVVTLSTNFIRENPDYTAELGDQALMGTLVEILGQESYWVKIKSPEPYFGWVNEMGLVRLTPEQVGEYLAAPKYICTALFTHVLENPSRKSSSITDLVQGDILRVGFKDNGKASRRKGFVEVVLPTDERGWVPEDEVEPFMEWASGRLAKASDEEGLRRDLVSAALDFKGVSYMWGGTSIKNVDCSGMTRSVYFANGVLLPRNASQQARVGEDVRIFNDEGTFTSDELLPGDLLFWGKAATAESRERISHVGMYIGDGKFIHSSQVVRINDFATYPRVPVRARRIVGHIDEKGSGVVSTLRSPWYFLQDGKL